MSKCAVHLSLTVLGLLLDRSALAVGSRFDRSGTTTGAKLLTGLQAQLRTIWWQGWTNGRTCSYVEWDVRGGIMQAASTQLEICMRDQTQALDVS